MKAEAYFIRAYDYAYLTRAYGGLVLIDQPFELNDDFLAVERSGLDETLAFILADLDKPIEGLPVKADLEQGRATKGAAAALKSKLLGWSTGELATCRSAPNNSIVTFQQRS